MSMRFLQAALLLMLWMVRSVALAADRPNVVVMLIDDMGVMDTSLPFLTDSTGKPKRYPLNEYYRTPNMEKLAAQGIRFNNFCAMSVCSPTRLSIMTGQNAARHRTTNWINPDNNNAGPQGAPEWNWRGLKKGDVTLPGLLKSSGYRTIHVGKGHFGPRGTEGEDPRNIGFDINVGGASMGQPANYYGKQNYGNAGGEIKKSSPNAVPHLEKYWGSDTFLTDALTQEALHHVSQSVADQQPFFLYLAHYAVHAPFNSDPRFAEHYQATARPANAQAFATLIEGIDKSLGDVVAKLQDLGVAENTLVIFLGDNGTDALLGHEHTVACAAPLRGKKGSHYEGGMRVPFIAAWAKPQADNAQQKKLPIAIGGVQSQQAAVMDLFPTVLNLAGTSIPNGHAVDGLDLAPLLSGQRALQRPERFLMHYPHGPHRTNYWTSLRDGPWKVIYHYFPTDVSGGSHYQLFNLASDPFEQQDLAGTQPDQLRRMMQLLTQSLEDHQALYPIDAQRQPVKPIIPQ